MLTFVMTSGTSIPVTHITLYPADGIAIITKLRGQASEELGGSGAGLGLIGFGGAGIAGVLALNALGAVLTASKTQKAIGYLQQAAELERKLMDSGMMFDVASIRGLDRPDPSHWQASTSMTETINVEAMSLFKRRETLAAVGMNSWDIQNGEITSTRKVGFAHDGGEFVQIESDGKVISVRWNAVESYHVT